jgi:hypothetical protein
VLSNKGFDSFSVPVPAGSVVTGLVFRDGDTDATNNWTGRVANGNVVWSAGDRLSPIGNNRGKTGNTLDWGTLYSFSVTVNHGPTSGSSSLHVATAGSPSAFSVATLVPGS